MRVTADWHCWNAQTEFSAGRRVFVYMHLSYVKIERYNAARNEDIYNHPEHCIFDITTPCFVEYDNRAEIPW